MNALQALMPTHAAFACAVTSTPAERPNCFLADAAPTASDPIRKFIIVRDPDGAEHPVIFSRALVHRTMVPPGTTPVSAGFLLVTGNSLKVLTHFDSSSLNLSPRPGDEALLQSFLNNTSHDSH